MKSLVYAALLGYIRAADPPTCTEAEQNDDGNLDRVQTCSTLTKCNDADTETYLNAKCNAEESCGNWAGLTDPDLGKCIRSDYCDVVANADGVSDVEYECPAGKKLPPKVANWKDSLSEADYKALYDKHLALSVTAPTWPYTSESRRQGDGGSIEENVVFDDGDVATVTANPGLEKGVVQLDLRNDDKLTVKTLPDKSAVITFKGGDGSSLTVTTTKDDQITLEYKNANLQTFTYSETGKDFVIPELKVDPNQPHTLVADGVASATASRRVLASAGAKSKEDLRGSFAIYTQASDLTAATLDVPALKLKLALKKFKGTGITHVEEESEVRFIREGEKCPVDESLLNRERNKDWNYDLHGADWAEKYPDCGLPQQSPINLLDPVTEFGRAYEIHPFEEDEHRADYVDLGPTAIEFNPQYYTIEVPIALAAGQAGFESKMGSEIFGGPGSWEGSEFVMRAASEHTINDVRYDLELQVYHKASIEEIEKAVVSADDDEEAGKEEVKDEEGGSRRRLAEEAKAEAAGSDGTSGTGKVEDKNGFKHGAVAILFSVSDYSDGATKALFEPFFDSLVLSEENPRVQSVALSNALSNVDWSERWAYKGSKTQPPCEQFVYWNVLKTVYPIDADDLRFFKRKLR